MKRPDLAVAHPVQCAAVLLSVLLFVCVGRVQAATTYNATMAVSYAIAWCGSRNPDYYDYTNTGGDCVNFVSQCLAAGGAESRGSRLSRWLRLYHQLSPAARLLGQ